MQNAYPVSKCDDKWGILCTGILETFASFHNVKEILSELITAVI